MKPGRAVENLLDRRPQDLARTGLRQPLDRDDALERRHWSDGWQSSIASPARGARTCASKPTKISRALLKEARVPAIQTNEHNGGLARLDDADTG